MFRRPVTGPGLYSDEPRGPPTSGCVKHPGCSRMQASLRLGKRLFGGAPLAPFVGTRTPCLPDQVCEIPGTDHTALGSLDWVTCFSQRNPPLKPPLPDPADVSINRFVLPSHEISRRHPILITKGIAFSARMHAWRCATDWQRPHPRCAASICADPRYASKRPWFSVRRITG